MTAVGQDHHKTPLVEIVVRGGTLLVKPVGPSIGQREAPIIEEEVKPFMIRLGSDLDNLVLDLTTVTFMSSMGLGMNRKAFLSVTRIRHVAHVCASSARPQTHTYPCTCTCTCAGARLPPEIGRAHV